MDMDKNMHNHMLHDHMRSPSCRTPRAGSSVMC